MKRSRFAFMAPFATLVVCLFCVGPCMGPSAMAGPPDTEWNDDDIYRDLETEYYLFDEPYTNDEAYVYEVDDEDFAFETEETYDDAEGFYDNNLEDLYDYELDRFEQHQRELAAMEEAASTQDDLLSDETTNATGQEPTEYEYSYDEAYCGEECWDEEEYNYGEYTADAEIEEQTATLCEAADEEVVTDTTAEESFWDEYEYGYDEAYWDDLDYWDYEDFFYGDETVGDELAADTTTQPEPASSPETTETATGESFDDLYGYEYDEDDWYEEEYWDSEYGYEAESEEAEVATDEPAEDEYDYAYDEAYWYGEEYWDDEETYADWEEGFWEKAYHEQQDVTSDPPVAADSDADSEPVPSDLIDDNYDYEQYIYEEEYWEETYDESEMAEDESDTQPSEETVTEAESATETEPYSYEYDEYDYEGYGYEYEDFEYDGYEYETYEYEPYDYEELNTAAAPDEPVESASADDSPVFPLTERLIECFRKTDVLAAPQAWTVNAVKGAVELVRWEDVVEALRSVSAVMTEAEEPTVAEPENADVAMEEAPLPPAIEEELPPVPLPPPIDGESELFEVADETTDSEEITR